MTTQTVQFESVSLSEVGSGTITAFLFSGTTLSATLASLTENGTLKGRYTGTVTDIAAGDYRLVVKYNGYTISEPEYLVALLLVTNTYVAYPVYSEETLANSPAGAGGGSATVENQELILAAIDTISADQLAAITVESGVIGNFPETLTVGDSYTENTGQIKVGITDSNGDPISEFGSLQLSEAAISFTAFRPNDSAIITGTCEFVEEVSETYVLITLPSTETSKGKAEYTYEGRLKFFWEGPSSGEADDEQKTYKTTPFKFIANP